MTEARLETLRLTPGDGERIVVDQLPGASPRIVFLHGLAAARNGAKSEFLLARARELGRAFTRFDFRGHGESSGTVSGMSLSRLIEDAETVLEHCGQSVIVGSSLGGMVAAWVAARRPELVAGLVLIAPAFGFVHMLQQQPPGEPFVLERPDGIRIELAPSVVDDARAYDERALPERQTSRVLIVHGEHDEVVPVAQSVEFFDRIRHPRKHLWIVPGGDHGLHGPMPEVWRRIRTLPPDPVDTA